MLKQQSLDELAYALSHDMGAPIRQISSYTSIALKDGQKDPQLQEECLEKIQIINTRLETMKKGIARYLKAVSPEYSKAETDGVAIIKQVITPYPDSIQYNGPDKHIIQACPKMLALIISELLDNAIEATDEKRANEIIVTIDTDASATQLTISDKGIGIPESELDYVTKLFYKTTIKKDSSKAGCGLAIVSELLTQYGMALSITSDTSGSSVKITLS